MGGTLSNALAKSKYTVSTGNPLSTCLGTLSRYANRFVKHDLPGKNPCCETLISLCYSKCSRYMEKKAIPIDRRKKIREQTFQNIPHINNNVSLSSTLERIQLQNSKSSERSLNFLDQVYMLN